MAPNGSTEEDAAALRSRGLRVTQPRLAVLAALVDLPHADADAVHRALLDAGTPTSSQSVHNVLGDLTAAGMLRRFEPARSPARYERRVGDNHHHAVCERCGRVEDVDCTIGETPCLDATTPAGFRVRAAEVTFVGLCSDCATSADTQT